MIHNDPYKSSNAEVQLYDIQNDRVNKMVWGQRFVICAALLYIISIALRITINPIFIVIFPFAFVLSFIGALKILPNIKIHIAVKALIFVLLFVPAINIVVLLNIYGQSIKSLRVAKYQKGFMKVNKPVKKA
jgi:uncharacterized membrane protein YjjP (DUF1212 family)